MIWLIAEQQEQGLHCNNHALAQNYGDAVHGQHAAIKIRQEYAQTRIYAEPIKASQQKNKAVQQANVLMEQYLTHAQSTSQNIALQEI